MLYAIGVILCYNNNDTPLLYDFESFFSPLTRQPKKMTNDTKIPPALWNQKTTMPRPEG